MKKIFQIVFIGWLSLHFQSCSNDELVMDPVITNACNDVNVIPWKLPETVLDYSPYVPSFIKNFFIDDLAAVYVAGNSQQAFVVSNELATLGRVLFYDKRLSVDNTISCASCHQQENAFSSSEQFSIGVFEQTTSRNSMALANLRWGTRFFWDARENSLEAQTLQPIVHPEEMGADLEELVIELEGLAGYDNLFEAAFGTSEINTERLSDALSHFVRAMVSFNSRYDIEFENDFQNFTAAELAGKDLFFDGNGLTSCNHCHSGPEILHFNTPMNNGLGADPNDLGLYEVTGNEADKGKFKTVTLRNIALTAPYMHDGRFETLEEVVQFYNSGVQAHPNLDDRLAVEVQTGGTPVQMNLSEEDISNLVAFLNTFTDEEFINAERFSDPFVE